MARCSRSELGTGGCVHEESNGSRTCLVQTLGRAGTNLGRDGLRRVGCTVWAPSGRQSMARCSRSEFGTGGCVHSTWCPCTRTKGNLQVGRKAICLQKKFGKSHLTAGFVSRLLLNVRVGHRGVCPLHMVALHTHTYTLTHTHTLALTHTHTQTQTHVVALPEGIWHM